MPAFGRANNYALCYQPTSHPASSKPHYSRFLICLSPSRYNGLLTWLMPLSAGCVRLRGGSHLGGQSGETSNQQKRCVAGPFLIENMPLG